MSRRAWGVLALFVFLGVSVSCDLGRLPIQVEPTPVPAPTLIFEPPRRGEDGLLRETRALWSRAGREAESRRDVDALVAKVDAAHLNVILVLAYYNGTAYFEPSHRRFPDAAQRLTDRSPFSDTDYPDALSYLLAIRDARRADADPANDFEVHAWFTVSRGGAVANTDDPPHADETAPYMLNALFPEFKLKYGDYYRRNDTRYVNHEISVVQEPKFRAYMADLIAGIVEDYHVDGVHLDYIRSGGICFNNEPLNYPGDEYDYPGCQADYEAWTRETYGRAYSLWEDTDGYNQIRDGGSGRVAAWLGHSVDGLVQQIQTEVKAANPDALVSVASVRNNVSRTNRQQQINGQSAWTWLDAGWIDAAFVTVYEPDTQVVLSVLQNFVATTHSANSRDRIFPGLATYNTDDSKDLWSDLIVEQVNAARRGQWAGRQLAQPALGVALFVDTRLSQKAVDLLGAGPFKEPARPAWNP